MKKNHLLVTVRRICQFCSWLMMKQKRTGTGNATGLGSKYVTFYACKKSNKKFPFQWYKERLNSNPSSSFPYHVYWPWIHVMASPKKVLKSFILYCKNFGRVKISDYFIFGHFFFCPKFFARNVCRFFFVPTHNSLFHTSDGYFSEICARLKLVSMPFSSLLLDVGNLEKRFPGSIM